MLAVAHRLVPAHAALMWVVQRLPNAVLASHQPVVFLARHAHIGVQPQRAAGPTFVDNELLDHTNRIRMDAAGPVTAAYDRCSDGSATIV